MTHGSRRAGEGAQLGHVLLCHYPTGTAWTSYSISSNPEQPSGLCTGKLRSRQLLEVRMRLSSASSVPQPRRPGRLWTRLLGGRASRRACKGWNEDGTLNLSHGCARSPVTLSRWGTCNPTPVQGTELLSFYCLAMSFYRTICECDCHCTIKDVPPALNN